MKEPKIILVEHQVYEDNCKECNKEIRSASPKALKHNLKLHEKKCKKDIENRKPIGRPRKIVEEIETPKQEPTQYKCPCGFITESKEEFEKHDGGCFLK